MNSLKELQIKAIHGMMGADDFLDFRDSLYKTLIVAKYKNLVGGMEGYEDSVGLSRSECLLVETCLDLFRKIDVADEYSIEKSFYLLKSLMLHFQVIGLQEAVEKTGRTGLNQDMDYKLFSKENLIEKIDVQKSDLNNMKTFAYYFARQKNSLHKYCRTELSECYELVSGLCEG